MRHEALCTPVGRVAWTMCVQGPCPGCREDSLRLLCEQLVELSGAERHPSAPETVSLPFLTSLSPRIGCKLGQRPGGGARGSRGPGIQRVLPRRMCTSEPWPYPVDTPHRHPRLLAPEQKPGQVGAAAPRPSRGHPACQPLPGKNPTALVCVTGSPSSRPAPAGDASPLHQARPCPASPLLGGVLGGGPRPPTWHQTLNIWAALTE